MESPRSPSSPFASALRSWAGRRADVSAVLMGGAGLTLLASADPVRVAQALVLTSAPERYEAGLDWLNGIGEPVLWRRDAPRAVRCLVADGWLARIAVAPDLEFLGGPAGVDARLIPSAPVCVYDRHGAGHVLLRHLVRPGPGDAPDSTALTDSVLDAMLASLEAACLLRAADETGARDLVEGSLRPLVRRLMAWHEWARQREHARRSTTHDAWAPENWHAEYRRTFAGPGEQEVWRALYRLYDLARAMAAEVAEKLDTPYPYETDERITDMLEQLASRSEPLYGAKRE